MRFPKQIDCVLQECAFNNRSHETVDAHADGPRFHHGVFLGIDRKTSQHTLHSGGEMRLARTVVRVLEAEKWSKELLATVAVTPMSMHQPREPEVNFKEKTDVDKEPFVDKPQIARRTYLRATDFEVHGLTQG